MAAAPPIPALMPYAPPRPAPATNAALCPQPLLDEWDYRPGGGYIGGRLCGNWSISDPSQRCCLPCPVQDWLYEDASESFSTADAIAIASLIFCVFLLLSWILLPAERSHRHHLSVGLVSSLAIISLAFAIPGLSSSSQICHDPITPSDIYSSASCGATGILLHFGSLSAGLWTLLGAIWLHLRLIWGKEPGKTFMLFAISVGSMVPVILIGLTIAISGYSYGVGNVCTVNDEHAAGVFYGWIVGLSVIGLLLMSWTLTHCILDHLRGRDYRFGRSSLTLEGGTVSRQAPIGADGSTTVRCSQIRNVFLGFLLPIEFLIVASIMWAADQQLLHAKDDSGLQAFVSCLTASDGQAHLCRQLTSGVLPAQSAVTFATVVTSLVGLQACFVHLTHPSLLKTYLQILHHPINTLVHKDYPPLANTAPTSTHALSILPSTSTLADKEYKVDQPIGSLRQVRRPSLASRKRRESAGHVLQLDDLHMPLPLPSPVREEGSPFGPSTPRPEGVNPYGYDREPSSFAGSSYSMVKIGERARPKSTDDGHDMPVSPISPIDNQLNRKSWFRESLFESVDITGPPSRPISPTAKPPPVAHTAPSTPTPTSLQRTLSKASRLVIPEALRPGLRRNQTDESSESPRLGRNASVAVHGIPPSRRENTGDARNPLRMNAVESFSNRRKSQA